MLNQSYYSISRQHNESSKAMTAIRQLLKCEPHNEYASICHILSLFDESSKELLKLHNSKDDSETELRKELMIVKQHYSDVYD